MCYHRNGRKMFSKLLKFLPQLIICTCIMVTMVQAFLTHEKNDIDDAADIVEHNQTHRKGRCKLEICCNFFQSLFLNIVFIR